jgi:serine protease
MAELPANNIITVGATTQSDGCPGFSNYGMEVDIGAPGENVVVSGMDGSIGIYANGTSFSCPYVTGAAALVLAVHPEMSGDPTAIKNKILDNADRPKSLGGIFANRRRLNVWAAIK